MSVRERWASPEEQARLYLAMGQKMGLEFEETREGMAQALAEQRNDPEWREGYERQCAAGKPAAGGCHDDTR